MRLAPAPEEGFASSAPVQAEALSPAVTQRLEPPVEARAVRTPVVGETDVVRSAPPANMVRVRTAPRAAVPPEPEPEPKEEDEFAGPRGPRLLNMMAVALVAATLGAGAGVYLYRRWQGAPVASLPAREPVARHDPALPPVTPSVAAETPPRVTEPAAAGGGGRESKTPRPAKTTAPSPRSPGGAPGQPAPSPPPLPVVAKATPAPAAKKDAPTPAAGGPAVAVVPSAPSAVSAPPAASTTPSAAAPKPAPSTPAVVPRAADDDERAPLDEEALAEQRQGEIMAEGILFVVKTRRPQWVGCYERAFKNETTLPSARVEIEFTIDREGRARRVKTVSNSTDSGQLASCLEHLLAEWQFPRPPAGEFATSYTFRIAGG